MSAWEKASIVHVACDFEMRNAYIYPAGPFGFWINRPIDFWANAPTPISIADLITIAEQEGFELVTFQPGEKGNVPAEQWILPSAILKRSREPANEKRK